MSARPGDLSVDVRELLEDMAREAAKDAEERFRIIGERILSAAESPIEQRLGLHLYNESECSPLQWVFWGNKFDTRQQSFEKNIIHVYQQIPFATEQGQLYRNDFVIIGEVGGNEAALIIECDGHEFHERTKQQAARDRYRDRYFTLKGIHTMRFTGSEIWEDASTCADQIVTFVHDKLIV